MRRELADVLTSYLMGWKNVRDCAEWISGIDWDIGLDQATRKLVGGIELLVTEVLEGLRPESEFWQEAAKFVANESGLLWAQPMSMMKVQVTHSSNDRSTPMVELTVAPEPAAAASRSWSISPPLVSG